jgi:hypothetical protein
MMSYPAHAKVVLTGAEQVKTTCLGLEIRTPGEVMELDLVDFNIDYRVPNVSVSAMGDSNLHWVSVTPVITIRGTGYPEMDKNGNWR